MTIHEKRFTACLLTFFSRKFATREKLWLQWKVYGSRWFSFHPTKLTYKAPYREFPLNDHHLKLLYFLLKRSQLTIICHNKFPPLIAIKPYRNFLSNDFHFSFNLGPSPPNSLCFLITEIDQYFCLA